MAPPGGIGLHAQRLLGAPATGMVLDAFWPGYAAALVLLQVWNLLGPVQPWAPLALGLLGAGGLVLQRGLLLATVQRAFARRRWSLAAALASVLAIACLGLAPITVHDTGLYHLQAVPWAEQSAAVPGLAHPAYSSVTINLTRAAPAATR